MTNIEVIDDVEEMAVADPGVPTKYTKQIITFSHAASRRSRQPWPRHNATASTSYLVIPSGALASASALQKTKNVYLLSQTMKDLPHTPFLVDRSSDSIILHSFSSFRFPAASTSSRIMQF